MINTLKQYNEYYSQNHALGNQSNNNVFEFTNRNSKLILSAPHSTRSFTNKHDKLSDLYTGALTQYLGENENISTLIRVKYTPYKCLISDYVIEHNLQKHYFLDIHGFNQDIDSDICIGIHTWKKENYPYLDKIILSANKYNLRYTINHPNYTGKFGLTGRYQEKFNQPNVIQIELKKHLRDFYNNSDTVKNITIPFMQNLINEYKKPD